MHDPPWDEQELLGRIAQQDEDALSTLYLRYRPQLWHYLFRQLNGDATWVEDALQDIFWSIWQSAKDYRGDAAPKAWIFRIAHHHVAKAHRHAASRPEGHAAVRATENEQLESFGETPSPEDEIVERLLLSDALSKLSLKQREVLELTFYQGFKLEEIAHILMIPVGTVKSRLNSARQALLRGLANLREELSISHD